MKTPSLAFALVLLATGAAHAQIGPLLWQDNCDDLANWIVLTGNGAWGWGNGELEYYSENNVSIADVAGEPGNHALRLTAREESGPEIVDQWGNPLHYTSGRVMSRSFVTVQYGMIEARVRVPDLDLGGWPAIWLLGNANFAWPRSGEIDLLEMGSHQSFRDLHDEHNGGDGLDHATVNQAVSANALFYTDTAVSPDNPSGAASLAWDPEDLYCRPYYDMTAGLTDRFLTYRLYWDVDSLRMTVIDGGEERELFTSPFTIDDESDEFRHPFYLLANLAIGGSFTDAYNLGDPGSGLPVSMPFPATMDIDYIRVFEWNGQGDVHLGPPPFAQGSFGVFTDTTPVDDAFVPGENAEIYVWEGTLTDGNIPPHEGDHVLSWQTTGLGWFGAGIMAHQPLNLFDFGDGNLEFWIKIPANVTFKIGVIDSWGNQHYVEFPAFQTTYGLVRNGEWGQAAIPVNDLRGVAIDLRMLSYAFVILEEHGTACTFAIDDIVWTGGGTTATPDAGTAPAVTLLPSAPNPFNAMTEIRFEMPLPGPYAIDVYDIAGRRVRRFSGIGEAGRNTLLWDGRDDAGATAASGVYTYRVQAGGAAVSGTMMMVK